MVLPPGQHDVGRMQDCWLVLDDDLTSRYHARLYVDERRAEIEDLGSRNGTFVNGSAITGRQMLRDGDRIRIGRETIAVLAIQSGRELSMELRKTRVPEDEKPFPNLIGQLIDKSLKVGKVKEAERYAMALLGQYRVVRVAFEHPTSQSCIRGVLAIAETTNDGLWIDRLFTLFSLQRWTIDTETLNAVRAALDRIPRVPGTGVRQYEERLRQLDRDGERVPAELRSAVGEIVDAYCTA